MSRSAGSAGVSAYALDRRGDARGCCRAGGHALVGRRREKLAGGAVVTGLEAAGEGRRDPRAAACVEEEERRRAGARGSGRGHGPVGACVARADARSCERAGRSRKNDHADQRTSMVGFGRSVLRSGQGRRGRTGSSRGRAAPREGERLQATDRCPCRWSKSNAERGDDIFVARDFASEMTLVSPMWAMRALGDSRWK